jgi:FMN phosphatase YigB (HAD superfamily)
MMRRDLSPSAMVRVALFDLDNTLFDRANAYRV